MRFIVRIGEDWSRSVECETDANFRIVHDGEPPPPPLVRLTDAAGRDFPRPPYALHPPGTRHAGLARCEDATEIAALWDAVHARSATAAEITTFGHYLFDLLLGETWWKRIRDHAAAANADHIELALAWPADNQHLHRLNWELMRSDADFLIQGAGARSVSITRRVESSNTAPAPLRVPPRILFVIGSALKDPAIRPGSELLKLLRRSRRQRAMRYRVLERATPEQIKQAVDDFEPDIVHFVCHGGVDPESGAVFLRLASDQEDGGTDRFGYQLVDDLRIKTKPPTIVVLSACMTGGGANGIHLAGAHEAAPLATELVMAGVPIVVGMAGHVADIASRLFARQFGEAIVNGLPLARATAEARTAAFMNGTNAMTTADWAFPAVFMSAGVKDGYAPVPAADNLALWNQVEDWIFRHGLVPHLEPVFCGREEIIQQFHGMLAPAADGGNPAPPVLSVFVASRERGYGRTRLLRELAAQAFREGHLPLLLLSDRDAAASPLKPPRTELELAARLDQEIDDLRTVLRLRYHDSQLGLLSDGHTAPGLEPGTANALRRSKLTVALARAARDDLDQLRRDAADANSFFAAPNGGAVVFLDDVDSYGELVAGLFAERHGVFDASGLGEGEQRVPVVMTYSRGGEADGWVGEIGSTRSLPWLQTAELKAFEENDEMSVYQLVLLHPFDARIWPQASELAWALDDSISDESRTYWVGKFRQAVEGLPKNFGKPLYQLVHGADRDREPMPRRACDEDHLPSLVVER